MHSEVFITLLRKRAAETRLWFRPHILKYYYILHCSVEFFKASTTSKAAKETLLGRFRSYLVLKLPYKRCLLTSSTQLLWIQLVQLYLVQRVSHSTAKDERPAEEGEKLCRIYSAITAVLFSAAAPKKEENIICPRINVGPADAATLS